MPGGLCVRPNGARVMCRQHVCNRVHASKPAKCPTTSSTKQNNGLLTPGWRTLCVLLEGCLLAAGMVLVGQGSAQRTACSGFVLLTCVQGGRM